MRIEPDLLAKADLMPEGRELPDSAAASNRPRWPVACIAVGAAASLAWTAGLVWLAMRLLV